MVIFFVYKFQSIANHQHRINHRSMLARQQWTVERAKHLKVGIYISVLCNASISVHYATILFTQKKMVKTRGLHGNGDCGYPRVYHGSGVEHGGNTAGMELGLTVLLRNWGQPLRSFYHCWQYCKQTASSVDALWMDCCSCTDCSRLSRGLTKTSWDAGTAVRQPVLH